jgi:putative transposase
VIFIVKETIDIMLKAYKYKIKPNSQQQELLQKFFGCVRFIYNWGLECKTSAYKENGTKVGYVELARELTSLKKEQEYEWLNECSNESLQQSLRCLDNAFTNFFRKKGKYPKFKSRKGKNSAKFINSVHFDFENWTVKLPKLGKVKLCKNRTFNQSTCKQGTCTVSRDHCGTYWCVITVDDLQSKVARTKPLKETAVGIDLGIKDYAILSDGTKFTNPEHLEKAQRKLA